jgi:LmbE family N-acetylglucosaminyl deacetylase
LTRHHENCCAKEHSTQDWRSVGEAVEMAVGRFTRRQVLAGGIGGAGAVLLGPVWTPGLGPVQAAGATGPSNGTLHISAHADDTILFLNPDEQSDIGLGDPVRAVFVTAGDAGLGASYWEGREAGALAAFAQMANVANTWTASVLTANGHPLVLQTLTGNPNISVVFMRLPDGNPNGTGFASTGYESLQELWTNEITTINAVDGSTSYSEADLVATLTNIMNGFEPATIRTQDFVDTFGDGDHSDHYATAQFTQAANDGYSSVSHQLTGYMGYPITNMQANLTESNQTAKINTFFTYAPYDSGVPQTPTQADGTQYDDWFAREYAVATIVGSTPPPSTTVLEPSNGAGLSGTAVLDAGASDSVSLSMVQFVLSGGSFQQSVIGTATLTWVGYLFSWDTTSTPDGAYTLQSLATDTAGNTAYSAGITVILDNNALPPPPSTTVAIPSNGATLSGTTVLDASASSEDPVSMVQFVLSGGSYNESVIGTATLTEYGYLFSWDTTGVPNGAYTLQSLVTDQLGQTAYSAAVSVTVDNSPPTTTVLIPSNGTALSGNALLDASVSTDVASVSFELTGGSITTPQVIATGTLTPYGWLAEWNTTTVPDGTYTLQSVASYTGGVSGTSTGITVTVGN